MIGKIIGEFEVMVDWKITKEQAFAGTKFGRIDYRMKEFAFNTIEWKSGKRKICLVELEGSDGYDVIRGLEKMGLKPGGIRELLALATEHPELTSVRALGDTWRDSISQAHYYPVVVRGLNGGRDLDAVRLDDFCQGIYLGVR